jgi:hypothetical protein
MYVSHSDCYLYVRFLLQTVVNAIPSFNWPGSKIPPSNLESLFGGGGGGSSPAKKSSPAPAASKGKAPAASKAAPKSSGKQGKNMTWGGRPDPTPELNIVKEESFLTADWRFGRK